MIKLLCTLILISSLETIQGNSDVTTVFKKCKRIFEPKALSTSCCKQTDQYVERIKECRGKSTKFTTCSQVRCVTEKYGLLTNGEVDEHKARLVLLKLDKIDSVTRHLNTLITRYCLNQDYRAFPSEIANCLPLKFVYCTFFAYRMGCGNVDPSATCKHIKRRVDTCKPSVDQYVQMLNKQKSW